jgi:multicomponent Na+:H+ antiporter subunit D
MIIEVFWALVILFFTAFFVPLFSHFTKTKFELRGMITFLAITAALGVLVLALPKILAGEILIYEMGAWSAPFGIVLVMDAFNYFIALTVMGIASLVTLFSIKHIEIKTGLTNFYVLILLMTIGLLGVTLTGDLFNLYVFFEIAAISSYVLVSFRSKKADALEGGFKYLVMGSLGTSFMLLGISFLYGLTGTLNMADMAVKLSGFQNSVVPLLAFALLLTGLSVKAVLVPMHFWKPDALVGTSSEVGGLIAGVTPAIGMYALFRLVFTVFPGSLTVISILIIMAIMTMVIGGLMAVVQTDLKRLLAYSSVSQSGYIALGLALAFFTPLGAQGGLFHILNNALATGLLFLCVGLIVYKTGTHDMNKLGGLARNSPLIAFAFLIGSLAVIGVPPLNGFASKFLIYEAGIQAGHIELTIIAVIMSLVTFAYYSKAFYKVFFGPHISKPIGKLPFTMILPISFLVVICILFGVFPQLALKLIEPAAAALSSKTAYIGAVIG